MLDLSRFDFSFRPETYWPEGFRTVVPETNPPPPHLVEDDMEVYMAQDLSWHWVTHEDEVEIARATTDDPVRLCARRDGDVIRYRLLMDEPELQIPPDEAFWLPRETSEAPLTFGELVALLDTIDILDEDGLPVTGLSTYAWDVFRTELDSRTERLMAVSHVRFRSDVYPELVSYYRAVGAHFVQTSELHQEGFELDDEWEEPPAT